MMNGAHAATGVLTGVGLAAVMQAPPAALAASALVGAGAALLPDIDHDQATITRSSGPITRGVAAGCLPDQLPTSNGALPMADTDQQALQIITQHWGTDPEHQLGRITIALGEDEHLSEFVDALAGGEGIYIPERDLHAALALCERELPEEQIAVALGDTPGRGVLSPAEYLAWWAKKALQV